MPRRIFFLIIAVFFFSNCSAYRYSTPSSSGKNELKTSSIFDELVLGISIDDDSLSFPGVPFSQDEIIIKLKRENIFKEVDRVELLKNKPDIILSGYSNLTNRGPDCWSCLFAMVSLGIIPRVFNIDEYIQFTFTPYNDTSEVSIIARDKYDDVFGWGSGILKISPKWKGEYDDDNFFNDFYNQLYDKREQFLELAKQ